MPSTQMLNAQAQLKEKEEKEGKKRRGRGDNLKFGNQEKHDQAQLNHQHKKY